MSMYGGSVDTRIHPHSIPIPHPIPPDGPLCNLWSSPLADLAHPYPNHSLEKLFSEINVLYFCCYRNKCSFFVAPIVVFCFLGGGKPGK